MNRDELSKALWAAREALAVTRPEHPGNAILHELLTAVDSRGSMIASEITTVEALWRLSPDEQRDLMARRLDASIATAITRALRPGYAIDRFDAQGKLVPTTHGGKGIAKHVASVQALVIPLVSRS